MNSKSSQRFLILVYFSTIMLYVSLYVLLQTACSKSSSITAKDTKKLEDDKDLFFIPILQKIGGRFIHNESYKTLTKKLFINNLCEKHYFIKRSNRGMEDG